MNAENVDVGKRVQHTDEVVVEFSAHGRESLSAAHHAHCVGVAF